MSALAAEVQVLTAEVRTLQVGSRQVTMSVFNQLDTVRQPSDVIPFGRVRPRAGTGVDVVGVDKNGVLVAGHLERPSRLLNLHDLTLHYSAHYAHPGEITLADGTACSTRLCTWRVCSDIPDEYGVWHFATGDAAKAESQAEMWLNWWHFWGEWTALPLIVLAGLR